MDDVEFPALEALIEKFREIWHFAADTEGIFGYGEDYNSERDERDRLIRAARDETDRVHSARRRSRPSKA